MSDDDDEAIARELLDAVRNLDSSEAIAGIAALFAAQREQILRVFADLASHIDRKAAEIEGRRPVDAAQLMRLHASTLRAAIEELER